jgi:hypothetical protein
LSQRLPEGDICDEAACEKQGLATILLREVSLQLVINGVITAQVPRSATASPEVGRETLK